MSTREMLVSAVLVIGIFVMGIMAGWSGGRHHARKEAVKAGAAEWRATPEGDVTFHWKEPKK